MALVLFAAVACRQAFEPSDASPGVTPAHAEQLFLALGARVSDPWRDARYDAARVKIANAAFIPSRVWDDTSVWVASAASRRTLFISGHSADGRYRLETAPVLAPLAEPSDSRHVINLTRLADDEYAWDTDVAYAIGTITAPEAAQLVGALWAAVGGRAQSDVRADYASVVPRATAALGQLFRVDSIRSAMLADRSTAATVAITMNPAGIARDFPNFATYLRRYAGSTVLHASVTDRGGVTFLQLDMSAGHVQLRTRSLHGSLVPLQPSQTPRPLPDSLWFNADLKLKVRRFTVGFRGYHGELTIVRTPHERAWTFISRREPEWVLPPVTERLLRTPLRRPFQGSGALFRIGVRDDSAGGQSVLHRRMHLEVQESLILRFIGRLGAIAVSDYSGQAEREQYAWLNAVFTALVADLRALRTEAPEKHESR